MTLLAFRPYTRAQLLARLNSVDGAIGIRVSAADFTLPTLAALDAQLREDLDLGIPVRDLARDEWQADPTTYRRRLESVVWHHWPGCPAWPVADYRECCAWWGAGCACRVCVASQPPPWWVE